jgi:exopolysaccharide production protein ExoQ
LPNQLFASTSLLPVAEFAAAHPHATSAGTYDDSGISHLAVTYVAVLVLMFFTMGGYLPTPAGHASSISVTSSASDTVFGQAFQGIVWATALLAMLPWTGKIFATAAQMWAMTCLPLFAVLSIAWSQDPGNSMRRGIFLLLGTVFAYYLVRRFTATELAQVFIITGVCAGMLGILVSVLLPAYGIDSFNGGAWQGLFRSKNGCAQVMLYLLSPAIAFKFQSRNMEVLRILLFPIAAVLLVMSMAKTSWLLAPGLLLLMALLSTLRRFERRDAVFMLAFGLALLPVAALVSMYLLPWLLQSLGKDPSLTGRVPLWTGAMLSILKRPLLGYGYAAFWNGLKGESLNIFMSTHFEIAQAQNGLLEVCLELGLVGVTLFLLTLVKAIKDAFTCIQRGHSQAVNWYIGIICLTVAYNLDEATIVMSHSIPWTMYIIGCTGLAMEARRLRSGLAQAANT